MIDYHPFNYFNDFLDNDSDKEDWSFQINKEDILKNCKHEWINVGFMHAKIVCKACDLAKEEWEKFIASTKKEQ